MFDDLRDLGHSACALFWLLGELEFEALLVHWVSPIYHKNGVSSVVSLLVIRYAHKMSSKSAYHFLLLWWTLFLISSTVVPVRSLCLAIVLSKYAGWSDKFQAVFGFQIFELPAIKLFASVYCDVCRNTISIDNMIFDEGCYLHGYNLLLNCPLYLFREVVSS